VIALGANALNLVLELVLVYPLHLGIAGSAWGTVVAQVVAALCYLLIVGREVRGSHASVAAHLPTIRRTAVVGGHLVIRTGSLLLAFLVSGAIAARIGNVQVAAHQVAWQIWFFLALCLDAIAIAGQAIVGRTLGAGDEHATRDSARRMLQWGWWAGVTFAVVVIGARPWLAALFTNDHAVQHATSVVLWAVALMQPVAALVFVLDGILIGAGDSRYLALAMAAATAVFLPCAAAVLVFHLGLLALWGAIWVFVLARLYGMLRRYRTSAWLVTGASVD
jgi:putative MATE family efflux protein